uniref:Uncharacterized protein n=1 Tax=Anguilla anguilla TaxID=7936 RepID=A0A0E9QU18_ANGAN
MKNPFHFLLGSETVREDSRHFWCEFRFASPGK